MRGIRFGCVVLLMAVTAAVTSPSASAWEALPTGTDVDYQLGAAVARPDHVGIIARDRTDEPAATSGRPTRSCAVIWP